MDSKDKNSKKNTDHNTIYGIDITKKLTVQKSTPLLALYNSDYTLQEFKLLDTYISRIDSHNPDRKRVRIGKAELEKLYGVDRINTRVLKDRLVHFMSCVVSVPDKDFPEGFRLVTLFQEANVTKDKNGALVVDLECTDAAQKYFFNIEKIGYLKYKLQNIASLNSRYSYIMYIYLESNRSHNRTRWEESLENVKQMMGGYNNE